MSAKNWNLTNPVITGRVTITDRISGRVHVIEVST